jgi:hypothetical protein
MKKFAAIFLLAALVAAPAFAVSFTPFQLGIWGPDAQLCEQGTPVWGLRLNLLKSQNDEVFGLDLGLVSRIGQADAISLNAVNSAVALKGAQFGFYNVVSRDAIGVQCGLYNIDESSIAGGQLGLVNIAQSVGGCQIGLFNRCISMNGIQVGLINIIEDAEVPFFPFVNASF